eukprot:597102-Prymnesium_polylepis.2
MTEGEPRTTVKHRTHDPLWYETLRLQTWLPPLELAPQVQPLCLDDALRRLPRSWAELLRDQTGHTAPGLVVVEVWNQEPGLAEHDFVGMYPCSLRSIEEVIRKPDHPPKPVERPKWVRLQSQGVHDGSGELLVSFELLPLEAPERPKESTAQKMSGVDPGKLLKSAQDFTEKRCRRCANPVRPAPAPPATYH